MTSREKGKNKEIKKKRKEVGQKTVCKEQTKGKAESGAFPPSLPPPSPPSAEHRLQGPGRPLIYFVVQKAPSAGFPFLFPSVKLKWGSVSKQGRGQNRSQSDPAEHPGGCKDRSDLQVGWRCWGHGIFGVVMILA